MTTAENTITYHYILFLNHSKILHNHCFQFLMGPFKLQKKTNNAYAKFWSDQERVSWHVIVFSLEVN